ncbi:YlmC/YmxH family sporulation protein [Texcoconibacillus texcoconensis]|uniref:YlmC/YmxH family sporulation protein n=1 Tax=Texcoconibacillus texcoconensis TaxID=1095777 RepID=A0A840QLC3_9BACI|nr:YlmC/YmxH family sporulation protein [Texcoconibacillus texcoconensis]MBB5172161.1 YlmC/YmxH family sporulation protein [Texcoconibacillus texcoconensis]
MIKISDIQSKDIVNLSDGKMIGHISDLDINLETGKVEALVIGDSKMMSLFQRGGQEVVIPWKNVIKIGSDVILVRTESGQSSSQASDETEGSDDA